METVTVTVTLPKELNDVRIAIIELIKDIRAGKKILEAGLENLKLLEQAVVGAGNIPAEIAQDKKDSIVFGGLFGGEIVAALTA